MLKAEAASVDASVLVVDPGEDGIFEPLDLDGSNTPPPQPPPKQPIYTLKDLALDPIETYRGKPPRRKWQFWK